MHPPPLHDVLDKRKAEDEDEEEPGDGRRLAHACEAKGVVVDVLDDRHRRLRRATACHDERLGEKLERADRLEEKQEESRRADQRQRHVTKALPTIGAVRVRRVIQLRRHALQCGEVYDHRKSGVLPQSQETTDHFEYAVLPSRSGSARGRPTS